MAKTKEDLAHERDRLRGVAKFERHRYNLASQRANKVEKQLWAAERKLTELGQEVIRVQRLMYERGNKSEAMLLEEARRIIEK